MKYSLFRFPSVIIKGRLSDLHRTKRYTHLISLWLQITNGKGDFFDEELAVLISDNSPGRRRITPQSKTTSVWKEIPLNLMLLSWKHVSLAFSYGFAFSQFNSFNFTKQTASFKTPSNKSFAISEAYKEHIDECLRRHECSFPSLHLRSAACNPGVPTCLPISLGHDMFHSGLLNLPY